MFCNEYHIGGGRMSKEKTINYCNGCDHVSLVLGEDEHKKYKCDKTSTIVYAPKNDEEEFWLISVPDDCPLNDEESAKVATGEKVLCWEDLKKEGSSHYRIGDIQPIDLLKDVKPHAFLTALQVKALTDDIKYAFRMLTKGANESDCDKIIHYTKMIKVILSERNTNGKQ